MKQAFVTGATRGIGRAIALRLARAGYEVGFCYRSNHKEADSLLDQLAEYCGGHAFPFDLVCTHLIPEFSRQVLAKMPEISVLVNNAGVSSYGLFQDVTETELERVLSVNFKSAFLLTKEIVPIMIRRGNGRIINVSSIWGQTGASCEVLYSASKAALIGFTKGLAKELAPSGITVNCVSPGVVDTDMMVAFSSDERRAIAEDIPCGRFATAEEVASAVTYLVSEEAAFITGQVFGINGGQYC